MIHHVVMNGQRQKCGIRPLCYLLHRSITIMAWVVGAVTFLVVYHGIVFLFKDSVTTSRMVHAGNYATMGGLQTWNPLTAGSGYTFAGIVVIKKGTWDDSTKRFKA